MDIGSTVQIIEDEYPEMVGLTGTVVRFSHDGTIAVVQRNDFQVWCSVANLREV